MLEQLESRLFFSAGEIDRHFGDHGVFVGGNGRAVVMSDGRIVIARFDRAPEGASNDVQLTLQRLTRDGKNDSSFHPVTVPLTDFRVDIFTAGDTPLAVRDRSDRLFVLGGFHLFCFLANGRLDASFGQRGAAALPPHNDVNDLLIDHAGRLIVAGSETKTNVTFSAGLSRYLPNGQLDLSFGLHGHSLLSMALDKGSTFEDGDFLPPSFPQVQRRAEILDVAEDSKGRLVAFRNVSTITRVDVDTFKNDTTRSVIRVNENGQVDTSFKRVPGRTSFRSFGGGNGAANGADFTENTVNPLSIAVDSRDRVLVNLNDLDGFDENFNGILRLTAKGKRDASFGENGFFDGFVVDTRSPVIDHMVPLPNGQIHVLAHDSVPKIQFRVNANGTLDSSFGSGGQLPVGGDVHVNDVLINPDGSLLFREGLRSNGFQSAGRLTRRFLDDGPAATIAARHILAPTPNSQVLDVTYRSNGAIDLSTLDRRDLRVTGPNGFVSYAKFAGVIASADSGLITARYKLGGQVGDWNSSDNGVYDVQLRGDQVMDTAGNAAQSRVLTRFIVRI